MNLSPATLTQAVWLKLRINRPNLLLAYSIHEDYRNISENHPSGSDMMIGGPLKRGEGLGKYKAIAGLGINAHLSALPNQDHGVSRRRQQDAFEIRHIGTDAVRFTRGNFCFTPEAFPFGQTDCRKLGFTGDRLLDNNESSAQPFSVPEIETRRPRLTDLDRLGSRHDRL
ncbi:MAG: hypothetical protein EBU04_08945 [Verrucomicrobia bacterium]|nr:hypothetical protein [Verrucomicrobiota bacterium]